MLLETFKTCKVCGESSFSTTFRNRYQCDLCLHLYSKEEYESLPSQIVDPVFVVVYPFFDSSLIPSSPVYMEAIYCCNTEWKYDYHHSGFTVYKTQKEALYRIFCLKDKDTVQEIKRKVFEDFNEQDLFVRAIPKPAWVTDHLIFSV